MVKQQLLFTGTGGQGLILAAIIMAEAGIIADRNVVQSQSYGPEARGGASKAEVILSDEPIEFPHVKDPDVVLTMSQKAYQKYGVNLGEDTTLITDSSFVHDDNLNQKNHYALPITKLTRNEFGTEQSANVVALGAVAAISGFITQEEVSQAVLKRAPKGTGDRNLKALKMGWKLGTEAKFPASVGNVS